MTGNALGIVIACLIMCDLGAVVTPDFSALSGKNPSDTGVLTGSG